MKIRIAILAACASTLALAQADIARANNAAASMSNGTVSVGESGAEPALVFARRVKLNPDMDAGAEFGRVKGKTRPAKSVVGRPDDDYRDSSGKLSGKSGNDLGNTEHRRVAPRRK